MRLINLPNIFTLLNLTSGCIGIIYCFEDNFQLGIYFILISVFFDFFDGFFARLLNTNKELGKQLDSLADVVSFGVLPGLIMFKMIGNYTTYDYLEYSGLIIVAGSALRLAKFNIDERQSENFIGLPTPAMALFVGSLPFVSYYNFNDLTLVFISVLLFIVMIAEINLISFKLKKGGLRQNWEKVLLMIILLSFLGILGIGGIPPAIVSYLIFGFVFSKIQKDTI